MAVDSYAFHLLAEVYVFSVDSEKCLLLICLFWWAEWCCLILGTNLYCSRFLAPHAFSGILTNIYRCCEVGAFPLTTFQVDWIHFIQLAKHYFTFQHYSSMYVCMYMCMCASNIIVIPLYPCLYSV